jgi:hypothetical protein
MMVAFIALIFSRERREQPRWWWFKLAGGLRCWKRRTVSCCRGAVGEVAEDLPEFPVQMVFKEVVGHKHKRINYARFLLRQDNDARNYATTVEFVPFQGTIILVFPFCASMH